MPNIGLVNDFGRMLIGLAWPYLGSVIAVSILAAAVHVSFGHLLRHLSWVVAMSTAAILALSNWSVLKYCAEFAERRFPVDGLVIGSWALMTSFVTVIGGATQIEQS